jgi:flagellum-specific peptidoglycan hydrolase FlgJ
MLFPENIIKAAQAAHQVTGCPASVTLAQWALESGYGKFTPPGSNNYFGIKAVPGQPFVQVPTHEFYGGTMHTEVARFAKYETIADGFEAHARLLTDPHGPYSAALRYKNNGLLFAQAIASRYATDPRYADKLTMLINQNKLLQFDQLV